MSNISLLWCPVRDVYIIDTESQCSGVEWNLDRSVAVIYYRIRIYSPSNESDCYYLIQCL